VCRDLTARGWSKLWGLLPSDRWPWFIPKVVEFFKRKSPLEGGHSTDVPFGYFRSGTKLT
jgi:hypothetical protein